MSPPAVTTVRTRPHIGKWLTGAGAGAVGAVAASVVLYVTGAFDAATLSLETLGILVMPGATFGFIYAGLASLNSLDALAAKQPTGILLGLAYGLLFWLTTLVGGPASIGGLLASLTFGVVVGLLYARSPYIPGG